MKFDENTKKIVLTCTVVLIVISIGVGIGFFVYHNAISDANITDDSNQSNNNSENDDIYSLEQLEAMALDYYELKNGVRPPLVGSSKNSEGFVDIQLYENLRDHNSTWAYYTIDPNTAKGTDSDGNIIDLTETLNNGNTYEDSKDILVKTIGLQNINEELIVDDNLKITFEGTERESGYYTYIAKVYLNNKLIPTNIFDNKSEKVIWSENHAARFKVEKINNVYFIISSIAKQNDGDYVLIINKDGKIIATASDVSIHIDESNKSFTIEDCKDIMVDAECSTEIRYILDNDISN